MCLLVYVVFVIAVYFIGIEAHVVASAFCLLVVGHVALEYLKDKRSGAVPRKSVLRPDSELDEADSALQAAEKQESDPYVKRDLRMQRDLIQAERRAKWDPETLLVAGWVIFMAAGGIYMFIRWVFS